MDILRLEGLFSKEAEMDLVDYYLFELDSMDLKVLARFIRDHLGNVDTCQVQIGQGTICFQAVAQNSFGAEVTGITVFCFVPVQEILTNWQGDFKKWLALQAILITSYMCIWTHTLQVPEMDCQI